MKMNTPTKITFVRILLTPLMIFLYLADFIPFGLGKLFAGITLFVACMTDFLDGYLARKNNQVTDMGKFLDPIADKLLATSAILLLITGTNPVIPTIAGVIFMFMNLQRDYVITGFRQIAQLKNKIIAADRLGKNKAIALYTTLVFGMVVAYIRELSFATLELLNIFTIIIYVLIGITCLFMILSEVNYFIKNPTVLQEENAENKEEKKENIEEVEEIEEK